MRPEPYAYLLSRGVLFGLDPTPVESPVRRTCRRSLRSGLVPAEAITAELQPAIVRTSAAHTDRARIVPIRRAYQSPLVASGGGLILLCTKL